MQTFVILLLSCSVTMSAIGCIFMALTPLISRRYSAKWRYYIWLVIVIGLIIPYRPQFFSTALLPVKMQDPSFISIANTEIGIGNKIFPGEIKADGFMTLWQTIAVLWLIGAVAFLAYHAWKHYRFIKMLNRWSEHITNPQILSVVHNLQSELNISKQIGIKACPGVSSPIMIGFFKSSIILPTIEMSPEKLHMILLHEIIHLKRKDLWYKALVLLASAIHWFNPFVHLMANAIAVQCEISCDEEVLKGTSLDTRRHYGETILGVARSGAKYQTALSQHFFSNKKALKTRVYSIMDNKEKKAGVMLFGVVLSSVISTGGAFAADKGRAEAVAHVITTESSSVIVVDRDGEMKQSADNGKTWEDFIPAEEPDWYTYEEYKSWLENEKIEIGKLVRAAEWTQQKAEQAIKTYEEILEEIRQGAKLSKPDTIKVGETDYAGIQFMSN